MDERTLQPTQGYARLKSDLSRFVAELAALFRDGLMTRPEAAE
jgi:hypothetical protein